MRLSPTLVSILVFSATLNLSLAARGENVQLASLAKVKEAHVTEKYPQSNQQPKQKQIDQVKTARGSSSRETPRQGLQRHEKASPHSSSVDKPRSVVKRRSTLHSSATTVCQTKTVEQLAKSRSKTNGAKSSLALANTNFCLLPAHLTPNKQQIKAKSQSQLTNLFGTETGNREWGTGKELVPNIGYKPLNLLMEQKKYLKQEGLPQCFNTSLSKPPVFKYEDSLFPVSCSPLPLKQYKQARSRVGNKGAHLSPVPSSKGGGTCTSKQCKHLAQAEFPGNDSPQLEIPIDGDRPPETPTPLPTPENQLPEEENQVPPAQIQPPADQTPPETEQAPAEPRVLVAEVVVAGAEDELEDIVYETVETQPGRTTTRSQLQEDVNAVYATGFFQDVTVTPEDTPLGVRITFAVEPNPILNQVTVETIPPEADARVLPPEVAENIFSDNYGQILNLQELQGDIKQLNQWYTENGYELAQVVGAPAVSPDGTVTLIVAEGVIEDIQVRYFDEEDEPIDGQTREFIITREIELESGDVFKRDTAQRDLQRVFGLGIFEDVRLSFSPGQDPRQVVINVDVVESSTGSVAAGAGFSSSSGLFGTISYQQQNLGGNNQTLGTQFQLGERELLFDLSFSDPWIGGDPFRTSYTINAFRRRSLSLVYDGDDEDIRTEDGNDNPRVVRTGGGINFSRPLSENPFTRADWTLSTGLQYQRVRIQNDDGDLSPISADEDGNENLAFSDSGEDDLFILRFGATRDRRNNSLQPTQGSLLRLGLDQTVPFGSGSILFNRLRGSYSYYIPVNLIDFTEGAQALAFNVQAGTVIGDLPPYEAFVVGGSNSVRGYPEGEVGSGRSYLQATAEYRFPIFSVVGGALFFDYGTTLGTEDNVPGEPAVVRDLPGDGYGYGIGVRVQSPLGPIRVDYAINDEGDNRIHFGIGERF